MADAKSWMHAKWPYVSHSARTAVAAIVSLLTARLLHLPEDYWAAITTLVIMQSTFGAALTASSQRFAGTALGAALGALLASLTNPSVTVFGLGVFGLGLICAILHLDRSAYRFAGITLAIVTLFARTRPPWITATHRFLEVTTGIIVGLILTALWPEPEPAA